MVAVTRVLLVAALCALSHALDCYLTHRGSMPSEVGSIYTFSEIVHYRTTYIQFPLCSCNDFITAVTCLTEPTYLHLSNDHNLTILTSKVFPINERVHFTSYCSKNHTPDSTCL